MMEDGRSSAGSGTARELAENEIPARLVARGALFRRLASENASPEIVKKLIKTADQEIGKKGPGR